MSVEAEYAVLKTRIWNAIDKGLLDAGEDAKDVLRQKIYDNVYSYQASPLAMRKRRYDNGGLGDTRNMVASVIDVGKSGRYDELQVEDFAGFQDIGSNFRGSHIGIGPSAAPTEDRLDEVVETGRTDYRQPGPRPFYKDAEEELFNGGVVTGRLVTALIEAGFEVEVV